MADRKKLLGGGAIALGVVAMAAALVSAPATAGESPHDAASSRDAVVERESTLPSASAPGGSPNAPVHTALPLPTETPDATISHAAADPPALPAESVPPLVAADGLSPTSEVTASRTSKGLYSRSPSTASEPRRAIPPSLSGEALRAELARGRAERERLEKLNAELDATRDALRKETERLEKLIAKGRAAARAAPEVTATPPAEAPPAEATPAPTGEAAPPETKADVAEALARALENAGSDGVDPRRLADLAKALKGMKSQQAAMVMSRLDDPLAARILLAMRPADAGSILARIPPERAGRLVQQIARLPEPSK